MRSTTSSRRTSPINLVEKIEDPVLLAHGRHDGVDRRAPCGEAGQLSWAPFPAGADLEQQGSPYLLIVPSDRQQARLICLGENHQLEPQGSGDDLVLYLYR